MVDDFILDKVLAKAKETIGIAKLDTTKIFTDVN